MVNKPASSQNKCDAPGDAARLPAGAEACAALDKRYVKGKAKSEGGMIRYSLKCDQGHVFDSWFASVSAYDALAGTRHLTCPQCGGSKIEKALMAPAVTGTVGSPSPQASLVSPGDDLQQKLTALRRHVEETADYVGPDFASEALAIHLGDAPERPIWGEARVDEARALIDEGVPVAPLPFMGKARVN